MTMAKLRIKMIPARIIREKGKEVAVTPQRGPVHSCGFRRRVTAEKKGRIGLASHSVLGHLWDNDLHLNL